MTRPQILFVDDEPSVLAGLRRALWGHRDRWDLHWAGSGDEALAHLRREHVDVLVTDMRMPGIDGAELLEQARSLYPSTARLVLSGHADQEAIVSAAGPTQQFLSKPCDPHVLINALEAALTALTLMDDPRLRSLIGGQCSLPKPPALYSELTALAADPNVKTVDVARLIERDVAASAEVLKLVNSSFFGLASEVTSIERAVTLLGLDVIQALILAGRVFSPTVALPPDLNPAQIADRGLRACLTVRRIGHREGWEPALVGHLGLGALLHDVGLLMLAADSHDAWTAYTQTDPSLPARTRETQAFGTTIATASAYLLGLWGFSRTVVTTLTDQPLDLDDPGALAAASPATLAVAVAHRIGVAPGDLLHPPATDAYLNERRLSAWQNG